MTRMPNKIAPPEPPLTVSSASVGRVAKPESFGGKTMNTRTAIAFVVLVLAATGVWATDNNATEEENRILTLVLKRSYPEGGFTVVAPVTGLAKMDSQDLKQTKKYIAENLQASGVAVTKLFDRLFERNKKRVRLTIKSAPEDGYLIDFDGKYQKYFEKDGGGWEKWYKENPKAHGDTRVSLPVYDQKSGLVLVYMGTQSHWLVGSGWIIVYKYEKGELIELNKVMMWIS